MVFVRCLDFRFEVEVGAEDYAKPFSPIMVLAFIPLTLLDYFGKMTEDVP
jgi:hypothetical protein